MKLLPSIFKQKKIKRSSNGASWKLWKPLRHLKTLTFYVKAKVAVSANPSFGLASQHRAVLDPSWSHKVVAKSGELLVESAVQAIRMRRLFFERGGSSSILGSARFVFQDCIVHAVETTDPYAEFRVSMEEMVASYGLVKSGMNGDSDGERNGQWEYLEGLLSWYLRMNENKNHDAIVEAFIDMYTALPACPYSSCSFSYNASGSSSKSKDWWEIKISETCPKYV